MSVERVMQHAHADARLSHPSRACQDANALLCAVLFQAFAIEHSNHSNHSNQSLRAVVKMCLAEVDALCALESKDPSIGIGEKVREWVHQAHTIHRNNGPNRPKQSVRYDASTNVGHVKESKEE